MKFQESPGWVIGLLVLTVSASACGAPAPTRAPTVSTTMVVTLQPTATSAPSTNTAVQPTETPVPPTETPIPPTDTPTWTLTSVPTETPTQVPTSTSSPTATRRPPTRVPPTNTPLPTLVWATQLVPGGSGYSGPIDVIIWNYYPNPLTFTIGGTTLSIHTYDNYPPNTGLIALNGPGSYPWSASIPGIGEAAGTFTFPVATKGMFLYFNHANPYQ